MIGGIRLGRVFGIPVVVNWTLLIAGAVFAWSLAAGQLPFAAPGAHPVAYAVAGVIGAAVFFGCVLAHELSHSLVARHNGVGVERITLWLLGGVAQLSGRVKDAGGEFRIAIAGPAMSVALGGLFGAIAWAAYQIGVPNVIVALCIWLALVNVVLAVFNMIPAAPLDGGRVLASGLWAAWKDRFRAEIAAANVGRVFGVLLVALGVVQLFTGGNGIWMGLLGLFIISAASAERRVAMLERAVGDATVRDKMNAPPVHVPGWQTVEHFFSSPPLVRHHVYPVTRWEGGVAGVVFVERLTQVPANMRSHVRVQDLAVDAPTAEPDERLIDVLERATGPLLLVMEQGQLVGVVTAEDLTRARAGERPVKV